MLECSMIKRKKIKHMKDYYSIFLHYSSTLFVYQELYFGSTEIHWHPQYTRNFDVIAIERIHR